MKTVTIVLHFCGILLGPQEYPKEPCVALGSHTASICAKGMADCLDIPLHSVKLVKVEPSP